MRIKYLGTAAAEGIPALFCECDVCKKALELGGKNIRTRTQFLINDDLLIDYPPDSYFHFLTHKIDFSKIHDLLITHVHSDHFYSRDFEYFLKGFSVPKKSLPFTIHGSIDVKPLINSYLSHECNPGLYYEELKPYYTYYIGNYKVIPLKANHGTDNPFVYVISDGAKTILYCHDTGMLSDETIVFLKNNKIYFDFMSLDCNIGNSDANIGHHMSLAMNRLLIKKLSEIGICDNKTKIAVNHFSHNGKDVLFDEMQNAVKNDCFIVSYDGLEINI